MSNPFTSNISPLAGADAYRLTPATMAYKLSQGTWIPAKHLLYVSSKIASGIARGNARIIVSLPPRHGKSELLSINTPNWILDRNPDHRVMLISYGAELAAEFSAKARDLAIAQAHLLNFSISRDKQRADHWRTTAGGAVYALGVGGPTTGRGANVILVDDYLKNAKDASSETIRRDIWEWFVSVARTRLEPGGSIIIIATRWNKQDLIGMLQDKMEQLSGIKGPKWEIINIPAVALENDILGREVGEALWPERYDIDDLNEIKVLLGNYYWQSIYQQAPVSRSSSQFDFNRLQKIDIIPNATKMRKTRFWDLAATEDGGDWTVGSLLFEDDVYGLTYIVDIRRAQLGPSATDDLITTTAEDDGHDVQIRMEQEPGAAGKIVIASYAKKLKGYSFQGVRSTGSKLIKAQPFFAAVENDLVRMKRAYWNQPLLDEFEMFPDSDFDDQVDSCAGAYNALQSKILRAGTWGRNKVSNDNSKADKQKLLAGTLIQGATFRS